MYVSGRRRSVCDDDGRGWICQISTLHLVCYKPFFHIPSTVIEAVKHLPKGKLF